MLLTEYQIHELAEKAGVSVRTIRFYIDEGLLPAPPVRGRYAVYSDEYLERLELIRRLKEKFLPLKEIRAQVSGLSRSEVRAALARSLEQPAEKPGRSAALDYINQVLKSQPGMHPPRSETQPPEPIPGEQWSRVRLAPGVELHIQAPVEADTRRKLEQLIHFARQVFNL